ncbi:hypothetical protein Tco_0253688 [Tanacetum coccineum]
MPVELGSFDIIIGMDWLKRCHTVIVCDEKLVQVPYGNEDVIIVTTSRYVVPTGRVKVPVGRYVVPTGKDNVIVSAGRTKVIPAGRTILVLVVLCLLRVGSIVS